MVRDLTAGSPLGKILGFGLPLLIGSLFQQFYSLADSIIVAKYLGVEAFAAIGSTNSLNLLTIGFALGFCSGLCIPIAQHFGRGSVKIIRSTLVNGLYLVALISLAIGVVMTLFTRPVLILLNTPANILDEACSYISVLFGGIAILLIYNLCIGYMRALGDSRTPFFILVVCCLLNVVLDLLFVAVLHMGVAGAAWATLVSQSLSALLCLGAIRKHFPLLHFTRKDAKISLPLIGKLCRISIPVGLQFFITATGSTILQAAINSLGSDAVAAVSVGGKVQAMLIAPMECAGIAIATFASQNLGAKRLDRVRTGTGQTMLACAAYSVVAFCVSRVFGSSLAEIFLSPSETEIHIMSQQYLNINTFFYICLSVILVYRNALQGLGLANATMFAGVPELVGRSIIGFLLVAPYGYMAACFGNPAAWSLAAIILFPLYGMAMRRLRKAPALDESQSLTIEPF